jgi:hypothetical protein
MRKAATQIYEILREGEDSVIKMHRFFLQEEIK